MTATSFTEAVATEAVGLFITYRGRRLWLDWHVAHEFAFFCSLTHKQKQRVRGAFVAGRWYWFVQVAPAPLSDDGAATPPADAQGAVNALQPVGPGQSAAESATAVGSSRGPVVVPVAREAVLAA